MPKTKLLNGTIEKAFYQTASEHINWKTPEAKIIIQQLEDEIMELSTSEEFDLFQLGKIYREITGHC